MNSPFSFTSTQLWEVIVDHHAKPPSHGSQPTGDRLFLWLQCSIGPGGSCGVHVLRFCEAGPTIRRWAFLGMTEGTAEQKKRRSHRSSRRFGCPPSRTSSGGFDWSIPVETRPQQVENRASSLWHVGSLRRAGAQLQGRRFCWVSLADE